MRGLHWRCGVRETRCVRRAGCLLALGFCLFPHQAVGQEALLQDQPAPESVEELDGAFAAQDREKPALPTLFPGLLKNRLARYSPFIRDSYARLRLRTYYLDRDEADDRQSRAWAYGGWLEARTGWWQDALALEAKFFTSQRLSGPRDKDGTLLLTEGQHAYSVLGVANAKVRWPLHELTLYRQELDLPYVNGQDSRMTPNTFQGYSLAGGIRKLDYGVAYLTDMKKRNADRFESMSEAAGVPDSSSGMLIGAVRFRPSQNLWYGVAEYWVRDVLNIVYTELDYKRPLPHGLALRLGAQFTDQRSVGRDLLTGDSFDTRVFGGRIAASYRSCVLSVAFSSTDDEQRIRNPFGSYPGYLSLIQRNFNRAGEDAWLVGFSYNFRRLGLPNLSLFTNYARGVDARDGDTGASLADRDEIDLTVDYKIEAGRWQGLWLRFRGSILKEEGSGDRTEEVRLILNYDLPLL